MTLNTHALRTAVFGVATQWLLAAVMLILQIVVNSTSLCAVRGTESAADLFLVPYPHSTDCRTPQKGRRVCWGSCKDGGRPCYNATALEQLIANGLSHLNAKTKERHLWLLTGDLQNHAPVLEKMPLILTLGGKRSAAPGTTNIIIPPPVLEPEYQPARLRHTNFTRQRKLSLFVMAGMVSGIRRDVISLLNKTGSIGNLPLEAIAMIDRRNLAYGPQVVWQKYRDSIFCPVLKGDLPYQKRFFDVALSGCLPVVIASASSVSGQDSWWSPGAEPWYLTHPFAKRNSSEQDRDHFVDYQSFVVTVREGHMNIVKTLEDLMKTPDTIKEMQVALAAAAPMLSYSVGGGVGDAFDTMLGHVEEYLDTLPP